MSDVHWTEVDGVTTIWTDSPGPLRAILRFRTGHADETVITSGHTHLIEHMVLAVINDPNSCNGYVDDLTTGFLTMGRPEDVSAFLLKVCQLLQSLPADRLETEKKILLAEAATRHYDVVGDLMVWRNGARGHGLKAMPEYGTRGATLEQLEAWRAQWFTRENAVLCLSGPLPEGLRLELPHGEKRPLPPLESIQPEFPSYYPNDRCGGIAAGALVPRTAAASVFNVVATNCLRDVLRTEQAVSYNPTVFYEPLNAQTAHLALFADSDSNRRTELADAFGKVIEKLTKIKTSEVDAAKKQYLDHTTGPLAPPLSERNMYEVQYAALDWLFGKEIESLEQIAAQAAEVSAAEVNTFSRELQKTWLFAVPGSAKIQPWMGKRALVTSGQAVIGKEIPSVDAPVERSLLLYNREGVSIRWPDDSHLTVRFAELSAALSYSDGCICLIGSDATHVVIEPTLWRSGRAVCREILKQVPAPLILDQGSRPAEAIPKRKTNLWQRLVAIYRWGTQW